MKKLTIITSVLLLCLTIFDATAQTKPVSSESKSQKVVQKYTCSMHPEVITNKPGKCPKCNMALIKKDVDVTKYSCSMHSTVSSTKPGNCPKCNMDLVKVKASSANYTCSMHPECVSDKEGSCVKCGMPMVKKGK